MNQQDPIQAMIKLQSIFLSQQISQELETRGYNNLELPQKLINICLESSSQQDFITKASNLITGISQHFLNSLYHQIKQKMPQKQQLQNYIHHQENLQQSQRQPIRQKQQNNEIVSKNFPGLCLPDKDQINLNLDDQVIDQQIINKQQQQYIQKKQQKSIKRYKYSSKSRSRSKSHHKKHKKDRYYRQSQQHQKKKKQKKKDKKKYKNQSRSRSRQKYQEQQIIKSQQEKQQLQQGKIYRGIITRIEKVGCFVKLLNVNQSGQGLVHISQIKQQQISTPYDVVKVGEKVWVKVINIMNDRIRLSMKQVNQKTGYQIIKTNNNVVNNQQIGDIGHLTGIKIEDNDQINQQGQAASYAQLWQMSRMKYMGGIVKSAPTIKQDIQEINIQMNDREPPFLRGQTTKAGINLSPVRVVKNPQGTLHRQAINAAQYARQRRQIRQQQSKAQVRDLSTILNEVTPRDDLKKQIRRQSKRNYQTIKDQRTSLPIHNYQTQLIKACFDNKILIVIGETGSGKTTQITQYLYNQGFAKKGKIGCTQPRRVAAMSVAKRVCEEMNVKLGEEVGYSIRFQDCTSNKTVIKYMTDGMLLRQALIDKYLTQYSVIMLDEAHERTIHTDVLFGILKKVVQKRNDFNLIVTSATLEAKKFSSYFFDCKIFSIPGRTYNVEILYSKQPETDYLDASLMCVMQIHLDQPQGDILLFLTGQEEIDTACQILNQRLKKFGKDVPQLIILPVYSALPSQLQTKIFEPAPKGKRKCVIATNIAEASLTIDGIYYVVDPGFAKIKIYNSKLGMDTLIVAPISQASAKQRAGRAGRTGPGKCYRIYTQQAYKTQMLPTSVPQIQRANLSNTVLELKAMGINDLINFDFMDPPPVQTLIAALEQLYYLSALDDQGLLTKLGRKMAQFPLEPPLSKMLLTSVDLGCSQEIVTIISMLSVQNIFYRPKQKETIADQKKTKFNHYEGDHLTYLNVFESWKNQNYSATWCHENFIQFRSLKRAQDVKKQITQLLQRYKFRLSSCSRNYSIIRKTIVAGFFFHAARKDPKGGYRTLVDDHQVYIHPSSSLFNKEPEWVVYHQLIFTTKQYMRDVCAINPKWLIDVAPNFFKFTDDIGFTRKKRNQRLDPLNQKYGDPNAWRLSKRKG